MNRRLTTLVAIFSTLFTFLAPLASVNADQVSVPSISSGGASTCAVTVLGGVRCWGYNGYGQLDVPSDLGQATQVSVGRYSACAVTVLGGVRCWGDNSYGLLDVPSDLGQATQVSVGYYSACAVTVLGGVRCWSYNIFGLLDVPSDLGQATQVSVGYNSACAVTVLGGVRCWGDNGYGQLNVAFLGTYLLPLKPTSLHASQDDGQSDVSWEYGYDETLGDVTVTVTASPGGQTCQTSYRNKGCRVYGLENGTPYSFSAVASNTVGASEASVPSNVVTPRAIWHSVGHYYLWGNDRIGSSLSIYHWWGYWSPDPESISYQWLRDGVSIENATGLNYVVQIADMNTTISVEVTAHHSGIDDYLLQVDSMYIPLQTSPSAPIGVQATVDDGQSTVSWDYNWEQTFRNVTFTVTASPGGSTCQTNYGNTSCNVYGLQNGTPYTFSVVASNQVGESSTVYSINPVTPKLRWHNVRSYQVEGSTSVGGTLNANVNSCWYWWNCNYWNPEPEGISYQWLRDGVPIDAETQSNYKVRFDDVGSSISVQVTASHSGVDDYVQQTSSVKVQNENIAFANSSCPAAAADTTVWRATVRQPTITGESSYTQSISGLTGSWPAKTKFCTFWYSAGVAVPGAYTKNLKLLGDNINKTIQFVTVGTSPSGFSSYRFSNMVPVRNATFVKAVLPKITGVSKFGVLLKGSSKSWNKGSTYAYQWLRNGEPISDAVNLNYTPGVDDLGSPLSLRVCGSQWGYDDLCLTSAVTIPVLSATFPTSLKASMQGSVRKVGSYLSAVIDGTPSEAEVGITWLRDGEPIEGATTASYKIIQADRGHSVGISFIISQPGYITLTKVTTAKRIP